MAGVAIPLCVLLAGCGSSPVATAAPAAPSSAPTSAVLSKAEAARLALEKLNNPWASATAAKLDVAGSAWCELVTGGRSIEEMARIFAENPPAPSEGLPTLNYQQAVAFGKTMTSVYCPGR